MRLQKIITILLVILISSYTHNLRNKEYCAEHILDQYKRLYNNNSLNSAILNLSSITNSLIILYRKYPALRTNSNIETIQNVGRTVISDANTQELINFILYNNQEFQKIRDLILNTLDLDDKVKKHAIVSGQSVVGIMAAIILAKSGYIVDVYDVREDYTRNIQWAARQSLVNELSSIDEYLVNSFLHKVASTIDKGSLHLKSDGTKRIRAHNGLSKQGLTYDIPHNGYDMIKKSSVVTFECKSLEKFLRNYLSKLANVRRHTGNIELIRCKQDKKYFCTTKGIKPQLIVIAEGSNSATRTMLGIKSFDVSHVRHQIAGSIEIEGGGIMIKHWRNEGKILLSGIIGTKNLGKTWVVADINIPYISCGSGQKDNYVFNKQAAIINEFRRLITEGMQLTPIEVAAIPIEGAVKGAKVSIFTLQQTISEVAFAGNNVILIGDAVGNSHWSVGGGMQIGAVCHLERLKTLLLDINMKMPLEIALQKYSNRVLSDSEAWGEEGIVDFYPDIDKNFIKRAYKLCIEEWRNGKIGSPLQCMKKLT